MEWTRYETLRGPQFTNSEGVNIQSYGGDVRHSDFEEKVDSGEYTIVDYVAPAREETPEWLAKRLARYAEKSYAEQLELFYDMFKDTHPDAELIKWQTDIKIDIPKT